MDASARKQFTTLLSWTGEAIEGLGELLREYPLPDAALRAPEARLAQLPPRTWEALRSARRHWPRRNPACREASAEAADGEHFIPLGDSRYPGSLRNIPDPPPWLFCRGDPACLSQPAVAVVGSRRASQAGLRAATQIGEQLAAAGYTVCSGLALGIDGAAHAGALRGGLTVAVLASGLDQASPHRHRRLAREVTRRGCLLSELPPGTPPGKHRFPRRNRIISGLAASTIIVEAALPSGSLHTAAAALEQGREVLVLPWSVYHRGGAGCLRLLRDGAQPICSLDELGSHFPGVSAGPGRPAVLPAGEAGRLLQALGDGALGLTELQQVMAMDIGPLLVLLGELEVAGWLAAEDGRYRRCPPTAL